MQARIVNAILESMQCSIWPYMRKVKSFSVDGQRRTGRGERGGEVNQVSVNQVSIATESITHTVKNLGLTISWKTRRFTTVEAVIGDYCIRLPILPILFYQTPFCACAITITFTNLFFYFLLLIFRVGFVCQISSQIPFLKIENSIGILPKTNGLWNVLLPIQIVQSKQGINEH